MVVVKGFVVTGIGTQSPKLRIHRLRPTLHVCQLTHECHLTFNFLAFEFTTTIFTSLTNSSMFVGGV